MRHQTYQQGYSVSNVIEKIATPKRNAIIIGPPISGLNTWNKRSEIDNNETPRCRNARIHRGYIEPRPGLTLIADSFDSDIMYIKEFPISDGSSYHMVITLKSIYKSLDLETYTRIPWYYSEGTIVSISGTTVTGSGTYWAQNVHAGDKFKLDTDVDWWTIQTVVSNTEITLSTSHPSGSGTYKIDRYFSGDNEDAFWSQVLGDVDWFVFCQGQDPVLYIDKNLDEVYRLSDDCPPAKYGILFADRLIIADIPNHPSRIKWCEVGDYTHWDPATYIGAGYKDFYEDPFPITGLSVIGGVAIVYKTYSICHMTRTGRSDNPFDFSTRIPGVGCYFPGGLVSIGPADGFIGSDNFYTYDLQNLANIGDKVKDRFLSVVNPAYISTSHGLVAEEFNEVQWFFPEAGYSKPNKVWTYNYDMEIFSSEWDMPATASGYATSQISYTWDSMKGTWDEQTEIWDSSQLQSAVPLNLVGNGTKLYKQDPMATTDDGTPFEFEWQTKEFKTDDQKYISVYRVIVEYTCTISGTFKVSISGDGGETFGTERTQEMVVGSGVQRAFFDFIETYPSVTVRIRVNDGGRYHITRVAILCIPSGEILK